MQTRRTGMGTVAQGSDDGTTRYATVSGVRDEPLQTVTQDRDKWQSLGEVFIALVTRAAPPKRAVEVPA